MLFSMGFVPKKSPKSVAVGALVTRELQIYDAEMGHGSVWKANQSWDMVAEYLITGRR